ncbi:MAG: potassium transporter Kup [Verrucomicrobiales bacterium]|nr:potassium transporter Kup [Verrucomicrobiales bacterium]
MNTERSGQNLRRLALGALGIVYGDIGTSPLYAFRQCVHETGQSATVETLMGSASLIVWALTLVVSIKYLALVLRADNQGEGGILALLALTSGKVSSEVSHWPALLSVLGLFGAALLYGDGILTPAITVLGAMEGLEVVWPSSHRFIVPAAVAILVVLFLIQRHGTGRVGSAFGPVMVVWFAVLAVLGTASILITPEVLRALHPGYALDFLLGHGWHGITILGSVFLVLTGAEALYADLGHFGARPIRWAWTLIVFPALALNYLGQAALVLRDPSASESPFFHLAPDSVAWALVVLAALAGIVASQALITGAFSLTMQAVQLGLLPRLNIEHTSASQRGQIYIGPVNFALGAGCIALVLMFKSSDALASAYGVAVSLTMVVTTLLLAVVARQRWQWQTRWIAMVFGAFLLIDLSFLCANLAKLHDGGWIPIALGAALFAVMSTWRRGRELLGRRLRTRLVRLEDFVEQVTTSASVTRVPGTAVFLTGSPDGTPVALLHNLKHNRVIHDRVVVLRFAVSEHPYVSDAERVLLEKLSPHFWRVTAHFGFVEEPSMDTVRDACRPHGLEWDDMTTTYFLGREVIVRSRHPVLPAWQAALFRLLSRNAQQPAAYYRLPPNRVVELGVQVEL